MSTLTGFAAIEFAEANDLLLNKYNDPTEDARQDLTPDEARAVAREDARLIWIDASEGLERAKMTQPIATHIDPNQGISPCTGTTEPCEHVIAAGGGYCSGYPVCGRFVVTADYWEGRIDTDD